MRALPPTLETPEHVADRAMGAELMAIDIEAQLEWAEAQGRAADALRLEAQLLVQLDQLADIVDAAPVAA